jgi:hypothetical protein
MVTHYLIIEINEQLFKIRRFFKMALQKFKVPVECTESVQIGGQTTAPKLYGGVQRSTADEAFTIGEKTSLLVLASNVASSRIVTMPKALAGRHFKVIWEVEQAGNDRVFTRQGSDTIGGNITTKQAGNAAGDGDVVAVATSTTAITCVDDVNIGSYLKFTCAVDGQWLVVGELIIDGVGKVPTLA